MRCWSVQNLGRLDRFNALAFYYEFSHFPQFFSFYSKFVLHLYYIAYRAFFVSVNQHWKSYMSKLYYICESVRRTLLSVMWKTHFSSFACCCAWWTVFVADSEESLVVQCSLTAMPPLTVLLGREEGEWCLNQECCPNLPKQNSKWITTGKEIPSNVHLLNRWTEQCRHSCI